MSSPLARKNGSGGYSLYLVGSPVPISTVQKGEPALDFSVASSGSFVQLQGLLRVPRVVWALLADANAVVCTHLISVRPRKC